MLGSHKHSQALAAANRKVRVLFICAVVSWFLLSVMFLVPFAQQSASSPSSVAPSSYPVASPPSYESNAQPANVVAKADSNVAPKRMLRYDRELPTGLGDRFSVLLTVAALARAAGNATVYTFWYEDSSSARNSDRHYPLTELRTYIRFPTNLVVLSYDEYKKTARNFPAITANIDETSAHNNNNNNRPQVTPLKAWRAYDSVYTLAWRTHRLPDGFPAVSQDSFLQAYRAVALEFSISRDLASLTNSGADGMPLALVLPHTYIAVHLRGTDMGDAAKDRYCTCDALQQLAAITRAPARSRAHHKDSKRVSEVQPVFPLVMLSDDATLLNSMLSCISYTPTASSSSASLSANNPSFSIISPQLIVLPSAGLSQLERALRDMYVLMHATAIVQHVMWGWSAFSSVAAMANRVPLLNTWLDPIGADKGGRLADFARMGGCPEELRSAVNKGEVERFVRELREQYSDA